MKTLLAVIILFSLPILAEASTVEDIKAAWYQIENEDTSTPVRVEEVDLNKDGKVEYAAYSSFFCGSTGCSYIVFANVNGTYCPVGKYMGLIDNVVTLDTSSCFDGFLLVNGARDVETTPGIFDGIDTSAYASTQVQHQAPPKKSPDELLRIRLIEKSWYGSKTIYFPVVELTGLDNGVTVTDMKFNRGNCPVESKKDSWHLNYGEVADIMYGCGASGIMEISLKLNGTPVTYTF